MAPLSNFSVNRVSSAPISKDCLVSGLPEERFALPGWGPVKQAFERNFGLLCGNPPTVLILLVVDLFDFDPLMHVYCGSTVR